MIIDDLQVILGPRLSFGKEEKKEKDAATPDKPTPTPKGKATMQNCKEPGEKKEGSSKDMIKLVLKNVTLTINRLHVRYEDDYYADQNPFAFGVFCEVPGSGRIDRKSIRSPLSPSGPSVPLTAANSSASSPSIPLFTKIGMETT